LSPWTFCKLYGYINCSCSNLQIFIRVTYNSVASCRVLTPGFSPTRSRIRFLSSDIWTDLSFPQLTAKVLNVSVPQSRRSIAANALSFGWRRCANVSWQRPTALRPLPFARPYMICMSASSINGYPSYFSIHDNTVKEI
jgi:hypothetical protein